MDQLDVTCFIISLFTAQRVSNVSTSILRSLRLIVDLFHMLYCSVRIEVLALASLFSGESDIKLVYLYSTIKMMHGPINLRLMSLVYYFII